MFKLVLSYTFNLFRGLSNDGYFNVIKLVVIGKMFCWLRPFLMLKNATFSFYTLLFHPFLQYILKNIVDTPIGNPHGLIRGDFIQTNGLTWFLDINTNSTQFIFFK